MQSTRYARVTARLLALALVCASGNSAYSQTADASQLRARLPKPCRIDIVIDTPNNGPLAYGYDTPSKTWYAVAYGASVACIDGQKVEHWRGNAEMRKLLGTDCRTPGFYRYVLPLPWLLDIASHPEAIHSFDRHSDGTATLTYIAPAGSLQLIGGNWGMADVTTIIVLNASGGIEKWSTSDQIDKGWITPNVIDEPAPGVQVFARDEGWTVRSATVTTPRRVTRPEFEAVAKEFLIAHAEFKQAREKGNHPLEQVRKNEVPDTSNILGEYPVRVRWSATWGPAVVTAGCVIACIAGVLAWRRRRGAIR